MMISEVLDWKEREYKEQVMNAYAPALKGFVAYFEECFKTLKISSKKVFEGNKDEKLYPLKIEGLNGKAMVMESQSNNYLFIYKLAAKSFEVKVYPFVRDSNAKDEDYPTMKPSLKHVLTQLNNSQHVLIEYKEDSSSKKVSLYRSPFYQVMHHSTFLNNLEFTCMALADEGCEEYDLQPLYDGFQTFFKEFKEHVEEGQKNQAPALTEEMRASIAKKLKDYLDGK